MEKINLEMDYKSWCDAIIDIINELLHEEEKVFWVIDGSAHPDFHNIIKQSNPSLRVLPIFMNTYQEEITNAGPWFIPYNLEHNFNKWLFSNLENLALGFLVKIDSSDEAILFEHLQQLFECITEDGKNAVFRYYDPRLLHGLSTSGDNKMINLVCGPAKEIYAWEPGRAQPIYFQRLSDEYTLCDEAPQLSDKFLDHLWQEAQCHTIINTLGEENGEQLRNLPLPEAYSFVEGIRNIMRHTKYLNNQDIALAVVYVMHSESKEPLKTIVNQILNGNYHPEQKFEDIIEENFK